MFSAGQGHVWVMAPFSQFRFSPIWSFYLSDLKSMNEAVGLEALQGLLHVPCDLGCLIHQFGSRVLQGVNTQGSCLVTYLYVIDWYPYQGQTLHVRIFVFVELNLNLCSVMFYVLFDVILFGRVLLKGKKQVLKRFKMYGFCFQVTCKDAALEIGTRLTVLTKLPNS